MEVDVMNNSGGDGVSETETPLAACVRLHREQAVMELAAYRKSIGGCWEYTGRLINGYGRIYIKGRTHAAHRLSYLINKGVDPGDQLVCHHCDNPRCINPHHLFLGDGYANMRDMASKGRNKDSSGESNPAAILTEGGVRAAVELIRAGWNNTDIACALRVQHSTISQIRRGKSWKPLLDEMGYQGSPKFKRRAPSA
jgi:hypothetical protein